MVFITLLSLFSFSDMDVPNIDIPYVDKLVHFIFYFIAALLGCMFVREVTNGKVTVGKAIRIIVLCVTIYGIIIEVVQSNFTPDREGDVLDILANTLGALWGALAVKFIFSVRTQLKWRN